MNQTSSSSGLKKTPIPDPVFDRYNAFIQERVKGIMAEPKARLFTTDADGLFPDYLAAFPEHLRQHHNCHACRRFIETYGGLVTIDDNGVTRSPFWDVEAAPADYSAPIRALAESVEDADVTGVFYTREMTWGDPTAGGWTHFGYKLHTVQSGLVGRTPFQSMASKREDFNTVMRALGEFTPAALEQAVRILEADALYRGEHLLGAATWLRDLQALRSTTKHRQRRNALMWRAIALAPEGFCHPRSGMLGTLLADIEAGLPFDDIKHRFDEKMHPLQYQRPQAAPAAGAIAQAEKLFAELGLAPALRRRFATLEDDGFWSIWRPAAAAPAGQPGVFSHLTPKGKSKASPMDLPEQRMTWVKFLRDVLPTAEAIEFYVPLAPSDYCALTTAVDPSAPPILQWDIPEMGRNPFAWYVYHLGSPASAWNLSAGQWVQVLAVTLQPTHWHGGCLAKHHGESAIFCLEGCRDTQRGGLGLFPECLRSELHGVRSVIEAHSRSGTCEMPESGTIAAGWRLQKDSRTGQQSRLRVTSRSLRSIIILDRWE